MWNLILFRFLSFFCCSKVYFASLCSNRQPYFGEEALLHFVVASLFFDYIGQPRHRLVQL